MALGSFSELTVLQPHCCVPLILPETAAQGAPPTFCLHGSPGRTAGGQRSGVGVGSLCRPPCALLSLAYLKAMQRCQLSPSLATWRSQSIHMKEPMKLTDPHVVQDGCCLTGTALRKRLPQAIDSLLIPRPCMLGFHAPPWLVSGDVPACAARRRDGPTGPPHGWVGGLGSWCVDFSAEAASGTNHPRPPHPDPRGCARSPQENRAPCVRELCGYG